jgi:transcriptional regulator with XRE-family HTH domain
MDLKSGTVEVSKTPESVNFSHAIQHAHDTSGLTWDEIAQLVGVSRRTIHNWLHGSKVTASNAKTLARVCSALERESKGDPIATRAHLLAPRLNGMSPYARALARHLDNEKKYIDYFNPSQRVSVRESPEDVHGTLLDIEELG